MKTTDRISLAEIARLEGVTQVCVWRWAKVGVRGHRLDSFFLGGRLFTTKAEYARFQAAINGGKVAT